MHFLQTRLVDVRVDLRCGDAGVAQHFLDLPQIGSAGKQMRGETMPHGVGTDIASDSCDMSILFNQFPNRLASHSSSRSGQKQPVRFRRSLCL